MGLIKQSLSEIVVLAGRLVQSTLEVFWVAICYVYILWWTVSSSGRRIVTESAIFVVLIATVLVVLEVASDLFRAHLELIHMPIWAEIGVVVVACSLVYHRYNEFRQMKEESVLAATVAWLFEEIAQLHFVSGEKGNYNALQTFVHKVLIAFVNVYHAKHHPQMNVMLQDQDSRLRIYFVEPASARYPDGLSFEPEKGGAGIAFSRSITIYFPAIRFRHGIGIVGGTYELLQTAYVPTEQEDFASVICAPIRCQGETFGVLNIDSRRQNAFDMTDIHVAQVTASAIGMAIDRHRTGS
jgi:hypothetical protein